MLSKVYNESVHAFGMLVDTELDGYYVGNRVRVILAAR